MEADDRAQRAFEPTELVGREHRKWFVTEAPAIESARLIHQNEAVLPEIASGRDSSGVRLTLPGRRNRVASNDLAIDGIGLEPPRTDARVYQAA